MEESENPDDQEDQGEQYERHRGPILVAGQGSSRTSQSYPLVAVEAYA